MRAGRRDPVGAGGWARRHPAAPAWAGRAWRLASGQAWLAVLALLALALAARFPNLWLQPPMTDEWREAGRALEIARGEALPLTNYDAFIGALWNYLLAGAYLALGPDLRVPRLLVMLAGALTVVPAYLLGSELGGRRAGVLTGLLLATSPVHVLVNSHIAWSNSTSPLFTTAGCWLLAGAARRASPRRLAGTRGGSAAPGALALAALAFGLAFQTHPTTFALVPGALLYLWLRARTLCRPRWLALAAALFLLGSANFVLALATHPGESLSNPSQAGAPNRLAVRHAASVGGYLTNLGYLGLSLARLPDGAALETLDPVEVLRQPLVWLYVGALGAGAVVAGRRGEPLALCLLGPAALLLALFQPSSYSPVPEGRYAMPLLPPLYASLALAATSARRWRVGATALAALLALPPLLGIAHYYAAHAQERAAFARIWGAMIEIQRAAAPGTPVVIDRRIQQQLDSYAQQTTLWPLWNAGLDAGYDRVDLVPPAPRGTVYLLDCATYPAARQQLGLVPLGSDPPEVCPGSRAARAP